DGLAETLKYVKLNSSLDITGGPETVDDGVTLNGISNSDGQHLVGDDSSVYVTSSGDVHVSYQDATAGKLRYAVGTANGNTHSWTVQQISQTGFAGAFSHVVN